MTELKTIVSIATSSFLSFLTVLFVLTTICIVVLALSRILRDFQVFWLEKKYNEAELEEKEKEDFEWKEDDRT